MTLTDHYRETATQLEPVTVVDRWHFCEVCGDIIDVCTVALETPLGLVHECCEDDARHTLGHNHEASAS